MADLKNFYNNALQKGIIDSNVSYDAFEQAMQKDAERKSFYLYATERGLKIGKEQEFYAYLDERLIPAQAAQPAIHAASPLQQLNPTVAANPAPTTEEEYQRNLEQQDIASGVATPLTDRDKDQMMLQNAEQMKRNAAQMAQRAGQMSMPEQPSLSLAPKDGSIAAATERMQQDNLRETNKRIAAQVMLKDTYSDRDALLDEMFPNAKLNGKSMSELTDKEKAAVRGALVQNDPYLKAADNILMGAGIRWNDARRQKGISWSNVGNGIVSFAKDATRHLLGDMEGTLSFGTSDIRDAMIQRQVLKKIADAEAYDNPENVLTPQEKVLYDAIATNIAVEIARQNDTSRWSKAGKITADMIPFVVDIMAGNALFKGMGNAARKAITQTVEKTVKNKLAKWLLVNGGDVATSAVESAMTATILPRTYAKMYENAAQVDMNKLDMSDDYRLKIGGVDQQSLGKSWAQAEGEQIKEIFTETGGNFRLIGRALIDNPIGKKILKTPFGMVLKRFEGAQGGAGSRFASMTMYHGVLGEWLEELEGAIYDGNLKDFFTADTQLPMLLSFAVPAAFTGGLNATQQALYQAKYDQAGKRIDKLIDASSYLGPDKNTIKGQILATLYQTPTENLPQAIGMCVEQVYPEEYKALMEGAPEKGNKAAELSYALKDYLTSGTVLTIFDPDMIGGQIADVQAHRQQMREQAEQNAQAEVQSISHADGNIYHVGIKGKEGAEGYAFRGDLDIVPNQDGTLSTRGRDLITIKMTDGTVEQVPADEVTLLDAPASAADRVQAVADHLFAQYANNDLFQIGDKVHIMQNGQPSEDSSTIVNITDEGVEVEIIDPNGQPNTTVIPHEQAAEMLSKVEGETEDGIVTYQTQDGNTVRLRDMGDGVYQSIVSDGETPEIFTEDELAQAGAVRVDQSAAQEAPTTPQEATAPEQTPAYPQDEEGNPDWGQIEVPQAAQILYDTFKQNNAAAISYADDQLKEAEKVQKTAAKQKSHSLNIAQRIAEDEQNAAFKAAADAAVKYWQDVKLAIGQIKTAEEQSAKEAQQQMMQQAREQRSKTEEGTVTAPTMAERYAAAEKIEGNTGTMTLPDGRELSGRYMLIAPQGVTPSHDVTKNYQRSEGYPVTSNGQSINDRDYTSDQEEQQKVQSIAQNFNGNAIKNMPVISDEGLVYNGNGRMMAGQLAAINGTDAAYTQSLMNNAAQYGFTPEQVASIPNARVVFQLDERLPYSTQSLAIFNEQETQTQSNTGKAAGYARKLTPQAVSEVLAAVDGFNTIDAFFSDKKAPFNLINSLINAGIIAQREKAEMVDGDKLSATGRERLSNILFGTVFDNETIRLMGDDAALKNSILRALPQILENKSLGEFSLESDINDAIRLLYEVRRAGIPFQSFVRQTVMSEDGQVHTAAENYSPYQLLLAEEMTDGGVDAFRDVLNLYNEQANTIQGGQVDIFSNLPTPTELKNLILQRYGKESTETERPSADRQTDNASASAPASNEQEKLNPSQVKAIEEAFSLYDTGADSNVYGLLNSIRDIAAGNAEIIRNVDEIRAGLDEEGLRDIDIRDEAVEELRRRLQSIITAAEVTEPAKIVPERSNSKQLQGMSYNVAEAEDLLGRMVRNILDENGYEDVEIVGTKVIGSRVNGNAREDSDLDFLIEFKGNAREDSLFNLLHEQPIEIDGVTVDINPITEGKSGTIEQFMRRSDEYLAEKAAKEAAETQSPKEQTAADFLNEALAEVSQGNVPANITIDETTIRDEEDSVEMDARLLIDGKPSNLSVTIFDQSLGSRGGYDPANLVKYYPFDNADNWSWEKADVLVNFFNNGEHSGKASVLDESYAVYFTSLQAAMEFAEFVNSDAANSPEVRLALAEAETDPNPTEAQKKAENYKQGHVTLWGLPITIENPKGSIRRGTDANGKQWEQEMHHTYGKIRRTEGVDGDHIDVFIGPNLTSDKVFVVDQRNVDTGEFDEHKCMLGFDSLEDAQNGYLSNYEEGWQGMGTVTEVTMDEFKKWIDSSHRKTKPFAEYKSVKPEGAAATAMEEPDAMREELAEELRKFDMGERSPMDENLVYDEEDMRNAVTDILKRFNSPRLKAAMDAITATFERQRAAGSEWLDVEDEEQALIDTVREVVGDKATSVEDRSLYEQAKANKAAAERGKPVSKMKKEDILAELEQYAKGNLYDMTPRMAKRIMSLAKKYGKNLPEPLANMADNAALLTDENSNKVTKNAENEQKSEKSSEKIWINRKNLVTLHRKKDKTENAAENWDWLEANIDRIVEDYKAKNGNVLDPDAAREYFSPIGYDGSNISQYRNLEKALVDILYSEMLDEALAQGKTKLVLLTGHGGAGKSTATRNNKDVQALMKEAGVVFDAAMNSFKSLDDRIGQAFYKGVKQEDVTIIPVYNDIVTSFENSLMRGEKTGRVLSIEYLLGKAFPENAGKLAKVHEVYPDITITPIDNAGNNGGRDVSIDEALQWNYDVTEKIINQILDKYEQYINKGGLTPNQIATIGEGLSNVEVTGGGMVSASLRSRLERLDTGVSGQVGVGETERPESSEQRGVRRPVEGKFKAGDKVIYKKKYPAAVIERNADGTYILEYPNNLMMPVRVMNAQESDIEPNNPPSGPTGSTPSKPTTKKRGGNDKATNNNNKTPKSEFGAKNTIVTQDEAADLTAQLKDLLSESNSLFAVADPMRDAERSAKIMQVGTRLAMYYIEGGARKFSDFCQAMVKRVGDVIRPYLRSLYMAARYNPAMAKYMAEMDDAGVVESFDVDNFDYKERNMPEIRDYKDVNGQDIHIDDVSMSKSDGKLYYDLTVTETSGRQRQTNVSVDTFNHELETKGIYPANEQPAEQKPAEQPTFESPMFKQFKAIKEQYPDATLMFRVGDFYELYEEDAVEASKILGITLTKRKDGRAFAGFPFHALDTYLPKLVRAGKRVAICDQLENQKEVKKEVKRGVTELVTPGEQYQESAPEAQPEPQQVVADTVGEITESKHTKTGAPIWVVKPMERVSDDEYKVLKARAKENNGYYSRFVKGFVFNSVNDATRFNNISDEQTTTEQTSADTETAIIQAETVAAETATIERAEPDDSAETEQSVDVITPDVEPTEQEFTERQEAIEKIDAAIEQVNEQLAVLGYYEADTSDPFAFHESYGYLKSAEAKALKDVDRLAKQLSADLGVDVNKRKKLATANIAPAGGDISFRLPIKDGLELYVHLGINPNRGLYYKPDGIQESYVISDMYWRVENPSANGSPRYLTGNQNYGSLYGPYGHTFPTYEKLLKDIRYYAGQYLPEVKAEPVEVAELPEDATMQDLYKQAKERKEAKAKKRSKNSVQDGQQVLSLFDDVVDELNDGVRQEEELNNEEEQGVPQGKVLLKSGELKYILMVSFKHDLTVEGSEPTLESIMTTDGKSYKPEEITAYNQDGTTQQIDNGRTEVRNDGQRESRTQKAGSAGQPADQNGTLGGSQRQTNEGTQSGGVGSSSEQHRVHDGERGGRPAQQRVSEPVAESERKNTHNFRYDPNDPAPTQPKARYEANLAAIRLLKQLQDEGRQATPEEQRVLAKFTGWGGLGEYFKGEPGTTYWSSHGEKSPYETIKELLTDEELAAAQLSRNSAYYTPTAIIDELWKIAEQLGFKGGNILEGSAGIGNILAQMPQSISDRSNLRAVEIDDITAGILAQLYPDAETHHSGFEEVDIPNNSQDLVITNVPFVTGLRVHDKKERDLSKRFHNIHDFCIAKNVRKLRQGGIGIFITSNGTLDSSKDLRRWLNNEGEADVIGAFRLNRETFGGTSVTSDIIVVQKRVNGQKSGHAIDVLDAVVGREVLQHFDQEEYDYNTRKWTKPADQLHPLSYNKYFVEHPENMGGEMGFGFEHGDTRWGGTTAGCYPSPSIDQAKRLAQWTQSLSIDPSTAVVTSAAPAPTGNHEKYEGTLPYGAIEVNSKGEICRVQHGELVPVEGINALKVKGDSKAEVVRQYNALKEAIAEALQVQTETDDDEAIKPALRKLNRVYDAFVNKYGSLNNNVSLSFIRKNDVQWSSTAAIEKVKETVDTNGKKKTTVSKTDLFTKRVVGVQTEPHPENTRDGIILSVQQFGDIRPQKIAEWLGKEAADVEREIIESRLGFRDPESGNIQVAHEYLSGNVREKLRYAQEHNENGEYDTNIEELQKVIPIDIPAHLIEFNVGSTWIPVELYYQYLQEKFGVKDLTIAHIGSAWVVKEQYYNPSLNNEKNRQEGVYSKDLDKQIYGHELFIDAMNNKVTVVQKVETDPYTKEKTTITDKVASAACNDKIGQIKDDFVEWARTKMQQDSELADRIQHIYNEKFNAIVPMLRIDPAFLSEHLPGQNHKYTLYPHQQQAVVRGTMQPIMLAHEVGTGKTISLISIAMEMRRLGTARKPMIVVQNATTKQFVNDAKDLYPNAKILTVDEVDRTAQGRREFYAKIKYNDWDLIIIPQSVLKTIPDNPSRIRDFIQDKIDEKIHAIEAARDAGLDDRTIKNMENELDNLRVDLANGDMQGKGGKKKVDEKKEAERRATAKAKAQEMVDRKTDEDVDDFDTLGIDALLVDEAHNYKRLGFATAMTRGIKGIDTAYSQQSVSLYLKLQSIFERCGHRNVVFATGTPISNTAAEIWTFMKYLLPKEVLKENDIYYFDDFVHNFGKITEMLEFGTNGKFKANLRFAQYGNVPELMRLWLSCADCVLTREVGEVNDKVPALEGGKAQDIFLPQSPSLIDIMAAVRAELDRYENMSGKEKKENSHIPLTMYGIAKRAAIDPRLVDSNAADEPVSKTNKAVEEVLRSLKETKKYNGTVALFCDSYQNKVSGFNLFEEIREKLIKGGVPTAQIAIIKQGMTDTAKQKIFDAVREGDIRVIMGTTETLGTGVNIQTRLHTLIHMDAPNRPMDYTQRNGRIVRQGNMHRQWDKPVRVLRFGVEDSLDVTAYQRLKTKASFIDSIMNGKSLIDNNLENRVLEDVEEGVFDNPVAILSGSQYALLKSQAERDLRKWANRLQQHNIEQIVLSDRLKRNASDAQWQQKRIAQYSAMAERINELFPNGEVKEYNIDGTVCHTPEQIREAIKAINKTISDRSEYIRKRGEEGAMETITVPVQFNGVLFNIDVQLNRNSTWKDGNRIISVKKIVTFYSETLGIGRLGSDTVDLNKLIENIVKEYLSGKDARDTVRYAQNAIERMEKENELIRPRIGQPFEHQAELDKAQALVDEYTEKMQAEMAEKEAKYAGLASDKKVTLTEQEDDETGDSEEAEAQIYDLPQYTGNLSEAQQLATRALIETLNDNTDLDVFLATNEEIEAQKKSILETATWSEMMLRANNATVVSSIDGAKVLKNLETTKLNYENRSKKVPKTVIGDISAAANLKNTGLSNYGTFQLEDGSYITLRISNHNATTANFDNEGETEGISIVISSYPSTGIDNTGGLAHLVEYYFKKKDLTDAYGTPIADIIGDIITLLKTGKYTDTTGLAQVEEVNVPAEMQMTEYSIRREAAPKKTGIGYKVFYRGKDGKLYPPMVANPNGADTPVGVWLNADAAPVVGETKTGRPQVKAGGKGTQGGSGTLAYRPGWHLGEIPYALQFNRKDENGEKTLFPKDFVWAEVEYAADVDYQQEANEAGINKNGNYEHAKAGLKHLPTNGYYRYRTNPNPETDPWIITGAMKVNRVLTNEEVDEIVRAAGREPQVREPMVTTDGTLYGWAIGDRIYLTKAGLNPNTPIHEYTHLWAKAMRRNNQEGWQSIVNIFKGTPFWQEVVDDENYASIRDNDDAICSEVLARYSGTRGAARMEEAAAEMLHEADQTDDLATFARTKRLISRVRQALSEFWHWVGVNLFGIKHFDSAEQVADRILWDMLNGTELKPEDQTTTNNFKAWFGDWQNDPEHASKVVDKKGRPLVVYHGSPYTFTEFRAGRPIYAFNKRNLADQYRHRRGNLGVSMRPAPESSIVEGYMNLRNPFIFEVHGAHYRIAKQYVDYQLHGTPYSYGDKPEWISADDVVKMVQEDGRYDGVIFKDMYDNLFSTDKVRGDIYVAFSPNQIKSATDNSGEFSEDNDDIEMMISGYTQEKQRTINEWYAAHPRPQYQVGEKLDHYRARLEQWNKEYKAFNEQMKDGMPTLQSEEKADSPTSAGAPAFVPGVRPTPMANETPYEYALRLRQYYQLMRDERLVAEYVAEINNQADAAAKVLKKNTIVRGLLDAAKPIENFQEWMKQRGATITDESNAYTDTFLATGRVTEANEQMQRDIIRPLAKQIAKIIAPDAKTGKSRLDGINIVWHNMDVAGTGSKLDGKALTPREIIGVYCQAKDCAEAIEKGLPDRGAKGFLNNLGMSHDDVIAAVESVIPRAELDELWRLINAATHFALNYDYESGRISEDTHTEFYQREFYVPQRGWRERDESGLITEYEPVGKRGNDPYNAALVKAHGRQSLASDPFAYIMSIDASSIVSSENNKIKQKFLQFCLDNENLGLQTGAFRVKKYWIMNVIDPETGKIKLDEEGNPMMEVSYVAPSAEDLSHDRTIKELIKKKRKEWAKVNQAYLERQSHGELGPQLEAAYKTKLSKIEQAIEDLEQQMHIAWNATNTNITQRTSDEKKQHEVRVLLDGQEYLIEVQDEKLANAINKKFKQHQEQLFNTSQKMRNATRFMSAVLTQYNPEFAASNFARDFQVALATLTAEHPELVGSFIKNFAACQPAVWQYAFNDKVRDRAVFRDSELGRYLQEYFKAGAATGFSYMQDLKSLRQDFDAMVNESNLRRGIKGAVGTLSMLTEVSETAVRFAGYVSARQKGMGVNEAAYLSKELTTNFDRAGEVADSGWMSWFSFFRATLNGNIKFLKALKKMPLAYSIIAAAYVAMGMLNQFLNPDDPEDEVWAGDFTRESNFVIGKWRIPTAHFLRMFFAAGVNAAKWIQGEKSFGEATYNTANFASQELLPNYLNLLGNGTEWNSREGKVDFTWEGLLQGVMPSPVSPIADVYFNRDFRGATINREPFAKSQEGTKDILLSKENTLPVYKWLTQAIYEGVGGNMNAKYQSDDPAWRSWLFDTSASSVEHVVEGYMPAGMDMFITLGEAIYDAATGTPTGPDKWPFVRKFYNAYTPERAYMQQYYLLNGRVKEFKRNMDDYRKNDRTKYNILTHSQEYRNYQEAERLVKKQKENPTTADVQALINANKQWIK